MGHRFWPSFGGYAGASRLRLCRRDFYDNHELPGRDMTLIPHPRVTETMERLDGQRAEVRSRVQFIHYNHTNPIRFLDAEETADVYARGFNIARAGDRHCLVTRVE